MVVRTAVRGRHICEVAADTEDVRSPHTNSSEASFQLSLGPVSPTHVLPLCIGQHVFGRQRQDIRNVPLAGTAPIGNRPDQFYPDRINLQVTGDPDGLCSPMSQASSPGRCC